MSIAPSLCSTMSKKLQRCFRRRTKSSGPKVHGASSLFNNASGMAPNHPAEVVSPSRLSPEMEARVQGLPFMWRPKCRKVLEGQTPDTQFVQIVIFESLPDYTKTACSPPSSTFIKELVHAPKPIVEHEPVCSPQPSTFITELHDLTPVVEYELNLDFCMNWFQDNAYEDEEDEEEEEFDDDATLRWIPAEWQQPAHEHVLPRMDLPRQVAVHSVVIKNAPVVPEYTALPSPPSPSPSPIPSPHVVKPLQRAARTKGRNGITRASARSAVPSSVLLPIQATNRAISHLVRCTSPSKPLRKHSDFRKLEDVSYDDFAQDLDERHKTSNGTRALGQLPVSVRPTQSALTKRKAFGSSTRTSNRPTFLSGRSISSKENWQQVEAAPLREHIPSTLGAVSPRVEDVELQWCHLSVNVSYGTFANGLDERRMTIDDAVDTQDWDY